MECPERGLGAWCYNRRMPVESFSDEQARRYGRYQGDPNPDQLERFFTFGDSELIDIARQRSDANRLGYAVQLGTVRFLGCFVDIPEVPGPVVHHVASGLGVEPEVFKAYSSSAGRFPHAVMIRKRYGYTSFGESPGRWRFLRWLFERVWTGDDRPSVLVDLVTYWLVENRVLLPGITTLTRLIARMRTEPGGVPGRQWAASSDPATWPVSSVSSKSTIVGPRCSRAFAGRLPSRPSTACWRRWSAWGRYRRSLVLAAWI